MIYIKGLIYGLFSISPGLSGGMLAIYLGDYEKIITIINNKNYKIDNIKFLSLLFAGFISGVIIFSNLINFFYTKYMNIFVDLIFILNILLLLIFIYKSKVRFKKLFILLFFSVLIVLILCGLDLNINVNNNILFFISGTVFSFSKIVPGVSSSSLLININFYKHLLTFFSNPLIIFKDIIPWLIFWVTFVIFSVFLIKVIYKYNYYIKYIAILVMIINLILMII